MFWKKKKSKNKLVTENTAYIYILNKLGNTATYEKAFVARIEVDPIEKNTYLINEEEGFKELYPEQDDIYNIKVEGKTKEEKIEFLKNEIKKLENKLKRKDFDGIKENEEDIILKIKILKVKINMIEKDDNVNHNYMWLGKQGAKSFFYLREGGELIPLKWNLTGKSIYSDIAYKKKQGSLAFQAIVQRYKNKISEIVNKTSVALLVIVGLLLIAELIGGYILFTKYHNFDKLYDQSNINKLRLEAQSSAIWCSAYIAETAKNMKNISQAQQEIINNLIKELNSSSQVKKPIHFTPTFIKTNVTNQTNTTKK